MKLISALFVAFIASCSSAFAFDQWPKVTVEVECTELRWQKGNPGQLIATFTDHASHHAIYTGKLGSGAAGDENVGQAILIEACAKADTQHDDHGRHWRFPLLVTVDPTTILNPIPTIVAVDWTNL